MTNTMKSLIKDIVRNDMKRRQKRAKHGKTS